MSYQVFARKYRPRTFDDILGQDHIVRTLRNAILQNRLAHAYLFVGPRGTGKTSTARIFAKALNCSGGPRVDFDPDESLAIEIAEGRSLDVLEIDGASNNGVEQVRELRETVKYAPASARFKIYYIDEVHMLSTAAFNALLKTLEEPPDHVKFIFATTEPQKILATILSRCQRFDLRPIPTQTIADHLLHIATLEKINLDQSAAWAIAKGADGGMRDAQSMLDQLVAFCGDRITEANVLDVFGFTSRETVAALVSALLAKDAAACLQLVHREHTNGRELGQLLADLVDTLRNLLVAKIDPATDGDGIPAELWQNLLRAAATVPADRILAVIDVCGDTEARMRWATYKRLHFEIGLMKAVQALGEARISDVIKALAGAADNLPTAAPDPPAVTSVLADPPLADPPLAASSASPLTPKSATKPPPAAPRKTGLLLDELIAQAADEPEPPPPAPLPTIETPPAPEPPPPAPPADDFHRDPLVDKALTDFAGTLRKP